MTHPPYVQDMIRQAYEDAEAAGELEPAHLQYRRLRGEIEALAEHVDLLAQVVAGLALVQHADPLADLAKSVMFKARAIAHREPEVEGTPV